MTSLLITPKNSRELLLLKELLGKMKIPSHELSTDQKADMALAIMMKEVNRSKKVSRKTIMKKLN
jgi:hypothetical protein